jgi:hypothetical protein
VRPGPSKSRSNEGGGRRWSANNFPTNIAIATGEPIDGDLPPRATRLIREWCELRRDALEDNWRRIEAELPLRPVEPLP